MGTAHGTKKTSNSHREQTRRPGCRDPARNQASESTSATPHNVDVIPHQDHIEATRRRSQSTWSFQDQPEEAKDQLNLFLC